MSLKINLTKCSPLQIYLTYGLVCSTRNLILNKTKCDSYIKDITRSLGIQLIATHQMKLFEMRLTLTTVKCVVLIIVQPHVKHNTMHVSLLVGDHKISAIKGEIKEITYFRSVSFSSEGASCVNDSSLNQFSKHATLNYLDATFKTAPGLK